MPKTKPSMTRRGRAVLCGSMGRSSNLCAAAALLGMVVWSLMGCTSTTTTDEGRTYGAADPAPTVASEEIKTVPLTSPLFRIENGVPVPVTVAEMAAALAASCDVVFFGEFHGNAQSHAAQYETLVAIADVRNDLVALSMEQWERDTQVMLSKYVRGSLAAGEFLEKSRPWPNWKDYWPMVEFARERGLSAIASNIPRRYASRIAREGPWIVDDLAAQDRSWVATRISTEDGAYKDKFMEFARRRDENFFAAQAVKDDTMAESIVFYTDLFPDVLVFHVNGGFHSNGGLGVPERVRSRRPDLRMAVVATVFGTDGVVPEDALGEGDYILVVPPPPPRATTPRAVPPTHGKTAE